MLGLALRMIKDEIRRIPSHRDQSTSLTVRDVIALYLRRKDEAIPDAWFGDDETRIGGISLDLATQVGDVHAKVESRIPERALPYRGKELLVRENAAGIGNEYRQ